MSRSTPKKYPSLRFFITVTIMIIVGLVLVLSVGFYYIKTSSILRKTSRDSIVRELNQVNDTIQDQVEIIDSIIPLFMSNEVIQNALENPGAGINYPFSTIAPPSLRRTLQTPSIFTTAVPRSTTLILLESWKMWTTPPSFCKALLIPPTRT